MKQVLATLVMLGLSQISAYAETLGTISANLDGSERTWFITRVDGQSQSKYENSASIVDSFLLWGNPDENAMAATKDVLSLDFTLLPAPKGKQVVNAELHYLLSGYSDQWDASAEGQTEVMLDVFEKSDKAMHVSGWFHATPIQAGEPREIDGAFDVTFPLD